MNTQFTSESPLFQDRQLPDTAPRNSWQQLTAGDERAERFEGFLRNALVVSLICSMLLCALRLQPETEAAHDSRLVLPAVQLQQVACETPAATPAPLPQTVALN